MDSSLHCDVLIQVISYLNVVDSCRFASTSRRMYYLVREYPFHPELVASSSWDEEEQSNRPTAELVKEAFGSIHGHPNLALSFTASRHNARRSAADVALVEKSLPEDTIMLNATAPDIQVNNLGNVEASSNTALIIGALSAKSTNIVPFRFEDSFSVEDLHSRLQTGAQQDFWKVFVVYCVGQDGYNQADSFVSSLQSLYPNAAIVGGICDSGHVRMSQDGNGKQMQLHRITDGIFGIALGGDVPVRSIVSRGVKGLADDHTNPWIVSKSILSHPGDDSYPFETDDTSTQPIHLITSVQKQGADASLSAHCFPGLSLQEPDFIGIRRPNQDGFELLPYFVYNDNVVPMLDPTSTNYQDSLMGASLDFFSLDGEACLQDMNDTLQKLSDVSRKEEILGAVMFSCSGRGPSQNSLLGEEMADASLFDKYFPDVPCLGFYAGGEIGPLALAQKQNVFQRGRAAVQGFTAVFMLFIVPKPPSKPDLMALNDSEENVANYIQEKLAS